jgi:hypothetical protein
MVVDSVTDARLAGVQVDIIDRLNLMTVYARLVTNANGAFDTDFTVPIDAQFLIILSKEGYVTKTTTSSNQISFLAPIGLTPGLTAAAHGSVRFSNGGIQFPVAGALVELFAGDTASAPVASATADSNGFFSVTGLAPIEHTVRLSARWFETFASSWTFSAGQSRNVGRVLPLNIDENIRFVLTWNHPLRDLDLIVEQAANTHGAALFRVDPANPGACDAPPFACIDSDVRDGNGAETVTVTDVKQGVYRVYVNNYTAWDLGLGGWDNSLSFSRARVDVYIGEQLVGTEHVPDGLGRTWFALKMYAPVVGSTAVGERLPPTFEFTRK